MKKLKLALIGMALVGCSKTELPQKHDPTIELARPVNNEQVKQGSELIIRGQIADIDDGIDYYTISIPDLNYSSTHDVEGVLLNIDRGIYIPRETPLGAYDVAVKVTDHSGAEASAIVQIEVVPGAGCTGTDVIAPVIDIIDYTITGSILNITGILSDNDGLCALELRLIGNDGTVIYTNALHFLGLSRYVLNWTIDLLKQGILPGDYVVELRLFDKAGKNKIRIL